MNVKVFAVILAMVRVSATTMRFGLIVVASTALGCNFNRTGLDFQASLVDSGIGVSADVSQVLDPPDAKMDVAVDVAGHVAADVRVDVAVDVRVDVAVDVRVDVAADVRVDSAVDMRGDSAADVPVDVAVDVPGDAGLICDPSLGVHRCGNACVGNQNVNTCGPVSCTPCPVPLNGTATCNGIACGVSCSPGFVAQASACVPACTATCDLGATAVTLPGGRFTGRTTGPSTAAGSCGGTSAPEHVYKLVLTVPSDVFVTTHGTAFDSVIYMRRGGCCGVEVACNDDADGRKTSVLSQTALPADTYYIFVDGATATAAGAYTVDIYATPASSNPAEACGRPMRISTAPIAGNTCGYADDYNPIDCLGDVTNSGPDAVYYFVLDAPSEVSFNTCAGTCIDSILYTREVCTTTATQGSCDDDSCSAPENCADHPTQSRIADTLGAGVHYLMVDTYPDIPQPCGLVTVTPAGIPP